MSNAQNTPGFSVALLRIIQNGEADVALRVTAASMLKKFVKQNWVVVCENIGMVVIKLVVSWLIHEFSALQLYLAVLALW